MNRQIKKFLACILCMSNLVAQAATPNNYTIANTSQVSYSIQTQSGNSPTSSDVVSSSTASVKTATNTPVTIGLGSVSQNSASTDVLSGGACYASNGNKQNLANPSFVSSNSVSVPSTVSFTNQNVVKSGDPLFIKIFDLNQVTNPSVIQNITVLITNDIGDKENVVLTETAPSSGLFLGYIQTVRSAVVQNDCLLSVKSNDKVTVSYTSNGNVAPVMASILVDPLGKVFDSTTGAFVNGAQVTLVNADTGLPAKVYGDDGVSTYPSTVTSGSAVTDSAGNTYNYGNGEFRFPLVKPGNYKITVIPPTGYSFPSQIDDATLRTMYPTYTIITGGSKGLTFAVVNSIVYLDVPVDKRSGNLVINKTVSNNIAALGDFIQYTVTIQNADKNSIQNVNLSDILPKGFKVKTDSVFVDNIKVNPVYDGKTIQYNLGTFLTNQTRTIKYVTQISMNSDLGNAINYATATGAGASSNIAKATVLVKDDLMSNKAIIVGNVYETEDCDRNKLKPIEGIKIQFETGDFVYSDKQGRWHIDSLQPMTHVAQIDKLSLPTDYTAVLCENNTRFAQNPYSQFVESRASSIERIDFYLKKKSLVEKRANAKELSIADLLGGGDAKVEVKNATTGEKNFKENNKAGTEALSLNDKFMLSATPEDKILFPEEKYNPSVPAIGFALQTKGNQKVKLTINDKPVNDFNFDGSRYTADKAVVIYYWRGIPLRDGKNTLIANIVDESGKTTNTMKKDLYFTTNIVEAHFVPSQSKLKANGKDPLEVAVRFIDEFGHPAHKGLSGTFELNGNYTPFIDRGDGLPLDMLNIRNDNKNQYVVGEDGIAFIKLMPTNQSGEMTLRFNLKDQQAIVRPWITADQREWILVGIAEGTKAFNNVSNHSASTPQKGMEIVEDNQGRIAFYGKGTIKGDYLLTMSYDNRKDSSLNQGTVSSATEELYSVYGDSTIAQKDAQSAKKIFIRIEKEKFYAMFGNYQTNLSVTDLTRFDRNLTGLKSEYKGDKYNYNVFAAKTATLEQKEEIKADGTTGPYRTASPIVIGSETVSIVLRNQNQRDQIISTKTLNRGIDYTVDYDLGIITLKDSASIYDAYFNPYYVHVEYNTLDSRGEHTVVGGRVAYEVNSKTEVGVTTVIDQGNQTKQQMTGVDVQYKDSHLILKMETAISNNQDIGVNQKGQAYNVEAQYQDSWGHVKGYAKKVDSDFGLTSALPADTGIQKVGGEVQLNLKEDTALKAEIVSQKDLTAHSSETQGDIKLEKKFNESFTGYVGDRIQTVNNAIISNTNISNSPTATTATTGNESSNSILLGGEYRFSNIPLKINTQIDYTPHPNLASPNKELVGAEYAFTNNLIGVADKQYNNYGSGITSDVNRIGIKYKPWTGGQLQTYVGDDSGMNPNKFYQVGLDQNLKFNLWSFDLGFAKQQWNKNIATTLVPAGTLLTQDNFDSYIVGATYRNEPLVYQIKVEEKTGSLENKSHLTNNLYRKIDDQWSFSLGQDYLKVNSSTTTNGLDTVTEDIRGGVSYRGKDNIVLGRLDWLGQEQNGQKSAKYVLNLHDDYKPGYDIEMFSHVGYKYVVTTFDTQEYTGSSYLVSAGVRKYLGKDWDIGIQALYAASPSVQTVSKGFGLSLGYNLFKNTWISVGYQKLNEYDRNYSFDDSYVNGLFIKFRVKFDEESFHLNNTAPTTTIK